MVKTLAFLSAIWLKAQKDCFKAQNIIVFFFFFFFLQILFQNFNINDL